MRRLVLAASLGVASCSPPPPAPVAEPPRPPAPAPAPSSSSVLTVTVDEGPPPQPPMALRWTHEMPSVRGQPWSVKRFVLAEDGSVTWETAEGEGDGELDELLQPKPRPVRPPALPCRGHVGPALHRRLVEAARRAMAAGCTQKVRVDDATTTIAVTWEGQIRSCEVGRTGAGAVAFERTRDEAVRLVCGR